MFIDKLDTQAELRRQCPDAPTTRTLYRTAVMDAWFTKGSGAQFLACEKKIPTDTTRVSSCLPCLRRTIRESDVSIPTQVQPDIAEMMSKNLWRYSSQLAFILNRSPFRTSTCIDGVPWTGPVGAVSCNGQEPQCDTCNNTEGIILSLISLSSQNPNPSTRFGFQTSVRFPYLRLRSWSSSGVLSRSQHRTAIASGHFKVKDASPVLGTATVKTSDINFSVSSTITADYYVAGDPQFNFGNFAVADLNGAYVSFTQEDAKAGAIVDLVIVNYNGKNYEVPIYKVTKSASSSSSTTQPGVSFGGFITPSTLNDRLHFALSVSIGAG